VPYGVLKKWASVPDVLLLGKALGGGMPLGAFIADNSLMQQLSANPVLGHITTFGGHPLCCAAGLAAFNALLDEGLVKDVEKKRNYLNPFLFIRPSNRFGHLGCGWRWPLIRSTPAKR
jgi:acetylornithine/N-succinyldiaminopimelate aminotransferase